VKNPVMTMTVILQPPKRENSLRNMSESKEGDSAVADNGISNPGILGIPPVDCVYDASSMGDLDLDAEVLGWIASHVPARVELFPPLYPFHTEYIPIAGEVDEFVKPPRPDGREDVLGTRRVDEAGVTQSDPTVLDLQLRAVSKKSGLEPMSLKVIEHAEKNPKEILKWVASIAELRRSAPPPSVRYSRPMPDIEELMQEWPAAFEQKLREVRFCPY